MKYICQKNEIITIFKNVFQITLPEDGETTTFRFSGHSVYLLTKNDKQSKSKNIIQAVEGYIYFYDCYYEQQRLKIYSKV
jgi:hypothetical protein